MRSMFRYRHHCLSTAAVTAGCLALGMAAPAFAQTATDTSTQATPAPAKPHARTHARSHKAATAPTGAAGSPSGTVSAAPYGAPQNNGTAAASVQSPGPAAAAATTAPPQRAENVSVTGSILRNPNLSGANPVTTLTAANLKDRGITTVAAALQQVTANGSGNLPANFTGNGAFASGASGVSLRGLTVDSTLVLIDGQRAAYYPFSDDGERNFVDINTIPQSIVQSIDVQQDGGSATYGADAVAGVVNIITRKTINGFEGGAEGGLTQRGDAGHQRLYANYGYGDLNRDNYNVWINGEYQQDDLLMNSQRGFPYNTADFSSLGGDPGQDPSIAHGANANPNGLTNGVFGGIGATRTAIVRPVTITGNSITNPGTITNRGGYQPINAALGCDGLVTHVVSSGTVCEQNLVNDYRVIQPSDRRISSTAKGTVNLGQNAQGYAMFTYSQNLVEFP
ncbi:MAG: TonB-dependent receptor plug domain-containing protein, partial [Gluconacetobacter diazotrophicus]|nr:TonB-dependent receptor plug domain-containing protein [Gluconacetobacter diazotrophicus]